jgi:SWI/SNF-related matrix-associated actin-dependent regulator 1 of chromatin subfamily A
MVIFDGERLIVSLSKGKNYKAVLDLGKTSKCFEYFPDINSVALSPTKNIARALFELGYPFDESAKIFLQKKPGIDFKSVDKKFELRPFQKEGVKIMLNSDTNILLADEMGLGKTPQASSYLRWGKDTWPALIVSPATLKENWRKEIKRWTGQDSYIIEGKKVENFSKEFLLKYPAIIINYDILGEEDKKAKAEEMEARKMAREMKYPRRNKIIKVNGWCDELSKMNFKTIIADEVQYISGAETIRSRALTQISFALPNAKKIFISGTPYETKTLQFYPALHILDTENFKSEYKYKMRFCNPVKTYWGWNFEGLSNAKELHEIISKFMIRRLKKDVLKDLPPKIRSVIPMKIKPTERKIYDDADWELELAIINKEKNALSKLEALKQASFKAKMNSMLSWIKEYLEINEKLVVFIWHRESCEILEKEFKGKCVSVTGDTPTKKRDELKERFQNDPKIKLFIGQIKSAGVGLTLTSSKVVAFLEFGSTAPGMEQAEDRVHRIGQTADSVLAYYLVLENSIDEQIMEILNKRNKDLKRVMNNEDEDLFEPKKEKEFSELILAEYKKKKQIA